MATKAQMKQRCKELESDLNEAHIQIELLREDLRLTEIEAVQLADDNRDIRQWYHEATNIKQHYYRCLSRIKYVLALDTIEQNTHRGRNDKFRTLIGNIAFWMDVTPSNIPDIDEIPF